VASPAEPDAIRDALARQVSGPVRWTALMGELVARGVTHLVECGPGKVLTGVNKRIAPTLSCHSVSDAASLEQTLQALGASA
jgi:[acyl-carrier-protein] S-malonyltransferase